MAERSTDWTSTMFLHDIRMDLNQGYLEITMTKTTPTLQSAVLSESYNSVTVFYLDKEKIEQNLKDAIRKLAQLRGIQKVVLFGSLINKRAVPGSDCDLLIIIKGYDNYSFFERIELIQPFFSDVGIACDIFPYCKDELIIPLAKQAFESGIVIFDDGFFPEFHIS